MSQQDQAFRVTLTGVLKAGNPVEAAHLFTQVAGRPGFDKFQVADEQGETHVVDMGLLVKMGVLKFEESKAQMEPEETEAVEEVEEVVAEEA